MNAVGEHESVTQAGNREQVTGSGSSLQPQPKTMNSKQVLGAESVLAQSVPSAQVPLENTQTSTTATDQTSAPLLQTNVALPPWLMIIAGIGVIVAGMAFIWSQRNDMNRI